MTCMREPERRFRLNSGIPMNRSWRGQFESCRRYFTKRHGNCAAVELFGQGSEGQANKLLRKAVIRSRWLVGPL